MGRVCFVTDSLSLVDKGAAPGLELDTVPSVDKLLCRRVRTVIVASSQSSLLGTVAGGQERLG